ncbi:hypothetical protein [Imhoffiella purpurea]|nr:hypothetical protein [Imhoffiella purpurea]
MTPTLDSMSVTSAVIATAAGSASLYLGLPRQQFLRQPFAGRRSLAYGLGLLALGWALWSLTLRPTTAFFAILTIGMACLILLPVLGAFTTGRGRR